MWRMAKAALPAQPSPGALSGYTLLMCFLVLLLPNCTFLLPNCTLLLHIYKIFTSYLHIFLPNNTFSLPNFRFLLSNCTLLLHIYTFYTFYFKCTFLLFLHFTSYYVVAHFL